MKNKSSFAPHYPEGTRSLVFERNALSHAINASLLARAGGIALASLVGLGSIVSCGPGGPDPFTVNTTADPAKLDGCDAAECTLREAIAAANANNNGPATVDEVVFDSEVTGTIKLNGSAIAINDELTITGPGADKLTVDANDQSRIFSAEASQVTISGLTLTNGYADSHLGDRRRPGVPLAAIGGAVSVYGDLALNGVTIRDSVAGRMGGGVFVRGNAGITDTTVSGNTSERDGGGGFYVYGDATITGSTITGNVAKNYGYGGGFKVNKGDVTVNNSNISSNTAHGNGGGFFVEEGSASVIAGTISGNTSGDRGGALMVREGRLSLKNSTVSGNTAEHSGGLYVDGSATVLNSTVSGNLETGLVSPSSGGFLVRGDATLKNSIVANNTAHENSDWEVAEFHVYGTLDVSHSLVEGDSDPAVTGPGNITGTDPKLGPLQDNGGPTFTHALMPASPALDAGTAECPPPGTDQRGVSRPADGDGDGKAVCDIGAFETKSGDSP